MKIDPSSTRLRQADIASLLDTSVKTISRLLTRVRIRLTESLGASANVNLVGPVQVDR
ncbi:hypothetical protein [Mesorhizobium ciceri]|uniref:hypothetical protein n=1 Tax=Mesorhizobium ciceri TaxID=39645 RepID=UPI0037579BA2